MLATSSGITTSPFTPQTNFLPSFDSSNPFIELNCGLLLPTIIFVKQPQPENTQLPISDTLSGIVTLVSPLQPENAPPLITITPSGITTSPLMPQISVSPSFDNRSPLADEYLILPSSTVIDCSILHPEKAPSRIPITLPGITTSPLTHFSNTLPSFDNRSPFMDE